jgi:subtilisin family serine protease
VQTAFQAVIPSGKFLKVYALPGGGSVALSTPPRDVVVGDHNLLVEIRPVATGVSNVWRLLVRNPTPATPVTVHAWALDDQDAPTVVFTGASAVDSMKIGSPGTAKSVVTVASYTTRVSWVDASSAAQSVNMTLNDISDFSSEGPLRNGAQKPDLAAPGAMIVSCRSAASTPDPAFDISANMTINAGTSMATPFVTGLVALLLERTPGLDPNQVKAALRAQCAIPGLAGGTFHHKWGHGFIDCSAL